MKKTPNKATSKVVSKTPTKSKLKSRNKLYHLGEGNLSDKKKQDETISIICPNCSHHFKAPPAPPQLQLEHSPISHIHQGQAAQSYSQIVESLNDSRISRTSLKPIREIMDLKGLEKLRWLNQISMSQRSRKSNPSEGVSSNSSPYKIESARKDPVVQAFTAPQKSSIKMPSIVDQKQGGELSLGTRQQLHRQIFDRFQIEYMLKSVLDWLLAVEGLQNLPSYLTVMIRQYMQAIDDCP